MPKYHLTINKNERFQIGLLPVLVAEIKSPDWLVLETEGAVRHRFDVKKSDKPVEILPNVFASTDGGNTRIKASVYIDAPPNLKMSRMK